MKTNPGGMISPAEMIGRDALIGRIWNALEHQGVIMTAERRIGKTTIIRKMQAEARPGWVPVFQELEGIHSADEFAIAVFEQVRKHLSGWKKFSHRAENLWKSIGGTEVGGVLKIPAGQGKHWKSLLTNTIADLVAEQAPNRLVFFWDEMPMMIESIRRREGEETAMEVLDIIRSLRQVHPAFRMVVSGSIGFHHVLTRLKEGNYANAPLNDLYQIEVPPLSRPDAEELARRLIEGEGIVANEMGPTTAAIADRADGVAFYVHHIVRCLKDAGPAEPTRVDEVVTRQMLDPNDPWQLAHYRERIAHYYPGDAPTVLTILDELASRPGPATVAEILAALHARGPYEDRDRLLKLLGLLQRDHYLARDGDGRYRFLFPLIGRWWALDRGL